MEGTVFTPSLEGMQHIRSPQGEMLTKPFLDVCKLILPVIDKFGTAMALVKRDIGRNTSRLEKKYQSDPFRYNYLYNMVKEEYECKSAKGSTSCTNGILWLTRYLYYILVHILRQLQNLILAMDFIVELFRNLLAHPDW
ncbi:hypothetical protein Gorai_006205, partial [Gossypium raimondii]|nr:hypothetical protein [Gossypium raimondii]